MAFPGECRLFVELGRESHQDGQRPVSCSLESGEHIVMERDLRRSRDRHGHPGPDPPSLDDHQHQGQLVSAQGEGQGRADPRARG